MPIIFSIFLLYFIADNNILMTFDELIFSNNFNLLESVLFLSYEIPFIIFLLLLILLLEKILLLLFNFLIVLLLEILLFCYYNLIL